MRDAYYESTEAGYLRRALAKLDTMLEELAEFVDAYEKANVAYTHLPPPTPANISDPEYAEQEVQLRTALGKAERDLIRAAREITEQFRGKKKE